MIVLVHFNHFIHLNSGFITAGTSAREHFLGHPSDGRVPKIIAKNIRVALQYVVYVYFSCCNPHVFVGASEMSIQLEGPSPTAEGKRKNEMLLVVKMHSSSFFFFFCFTKR